MDESTLVKRILTRLKTEYPMGVWYKIHTGPFQERGIPDIVGCLRGRFVAFEVKTPQARRGVTNYQKIQLDRINSADGRATVIKSVKEALAFLGKQFKDLRVKTKEEPEVKEKPQEPEEHEEPPITDALEQESTVSDNTEVKEPEKKADEKPKKKRPKKDKKKKKSRKKK